MGGILDIYWGGGEGEGVSCVGTFLVKNLVYTTIRVLLSEAGLVPKQIVMLLIYANTILKFVKTCRPFMGFSKTNTDIPLLKFKGIL